MAAARLLQSSCLRDTHWTDSQSYSSEGEGGEGRSRNKPTPGREQTRGELSSILQADKSAEPCVAQGNLSQLEPFPKPKAQVAAAPRSNPSAELWISSSNSKLLRKILFCSRSACTQNTHCPVSKLISSRGARTLHSGHSHLPCLHNLHGKKPCIVRERKKKSLCPMRHSDKAKHSYLSSGENCSCLLQVSIPHLTVLPSHKIRMFFKKLLVPRAQKGH